MENLNELIHTLVAYLQEISKPTSGWELFIKNILPIIEVTVIVAGALGGLKKYYSLKNREINEKMLNEVYAPLYEYFVKQETFCFISKLKRDYKESPILEIISEKVKKKISFEEGINIKVESTEKSILGLTREELFAAVNSINVGLASKELLTLLNIYKVLIYFETSSDKGTDRYLDATIMKVDVENLLRKEIIKGYKYYHKKLGLETITTNDLYEIEDDNIKIRYVIDEEVKEKLRNEIKED